MRSMTFVPAGFLVLSLVVCHAPGQTTVFEDAKLLPSDGPAGSFGLSVAVSGDVAVVGAPFSDSAYVYRFDGTSWSEEAKLLASDGAAGDFFGFSVAVSGDVAVIGARLDDDSGFSSGSAYVYRFDGTSWIEEAKLLASDGAASDNFGRSVAVSGDVAVVGANQDDGNGSAYVYRFDGTSWSEEAKLLASDGTPLDSFGVSVAVSGDVAVIGAADVGGSQGSAYVYRFDDTSWSEEAKLLASDGFGGIFSGDEFGRSVAVSGDVAVVGSSFLGSAYVFDLPDPIQSLLDLIAKVDSLNLQNGIANSLDAKIAAALQALDDVVDNNDGAAIAALGAFINAVQAQSGNWISVEDADCLIADAQAIIDLLSA